MKVVQIFAMDQQIQHVITLSKHLKTNFHPVQCRGLEELRRLEGAEQVSRKVKITFELLVFELE